ncbi:hypothetical protein B0T16DRAFT_64759 [Cercophora newfieldiana]|uniref:DUF8004 domain-containing protein n=1 Tax=Cercophora newfieldiana TaxID=92897 RepID=A0AA40CZR2_9PEZI|nr:hypothetical protein B0T16DRAFT_64759 [Cercophora newfieldiana]
MASNPNVAHQAHYPNRKPLPNQQQQQPQQQQQQYHHQRQQQQQVPVGFWQPVYVVNGHPPHPSGAPVVHGWPATHAIPPAPLQPPPLPPKAPYAAHGRNNSLPMPTTLRKDPKMPPSSTTPAMPVLTATQASPPRQNPHQRGRSESPSPRSPAGKLQPNRLQPRHPAPSPSPRGRSTSAEPPTVRIPVDDAPRAASNPANPIPRSSASSDGDSPGPKSKRRSWLPGGRSRSGSNDMDVNSRPGAWVMTPGGRADYNPSILTGGDKVPELWSEAGNVCVYLHPKERGLGPSFKVADHVFASSRILNERLLSENMHGSPQGSPFLTADDAARRQSPSRPGPGNYRLYLPLANTNIETLVAARNLFALLTNQPLVGTKASPTVFAALLQVAALLRDFAFSSYDGSSFGEEVDTAFDSLVEQLGIADVRGSREKTIEALVLAEQMRSWNLYNEAFTHAVGKYDDLFELDSPLFSKVSVSTRNRMERAHLSLMNCEQNVNQRLSAFEFPSLFAGIASSTSHKEYQNVNFKEWRNSFGKMRHFVLSYYKDLFGNWPPKAKSKKNQFSRGGLNRQALKILYWDLCSLYDLLVDRESATTRAIDDQPFEDGEDAASNPSISALRKILTEFDHSSPPVLPPIPFDVPKLPTMTTIRENYNALPSKEQAKFDRHLQSNELLLLLIKSRNIDTDSLQRPFLNAFKEFELKEARGVHPHGLADQRIGHWLFLYVVIQSLPMLVVDAPDLKYTEGVEYFLCQAPQGNPPWNEDAGEVRKMWYRAGGQSLVELSADVVMFSVEGIYTRSHCWMAAKRWEESSRPTSSGNPGQPVLDQPPADGPSPLAPPRAVFQDMDPVTNPHAGGLSPQNASPTGSPLLHPRNTPQHSGGRGGNHAYRWSVSMGLEPLTLGDERGSRVMSGGSGHSRHSSIAGLEAVGNPRQGSRTPSIGNLRQAGGGAETSSSPAPGQGQSTFDDILKGMEKKEKKKRSFF